MNKKFDYDDINLIPKYSIVNSRSECDTSIKIGNNLFKNPIIPANMESVINEELAIKLAKEGYFYVMHRFNINNREFVKKMKSLNLITSISIGVNQESYDDILYFSNNNISIDYITIDIAHGHCKKMKKMVKYVKEKLPNSFLIAGNVSSIEGTIDLDKWGADAIKVGIGPGCFAAETQVLTKNGYKNISDVKLDDLVLTHKNKYEKVTTKISYHEEDDIISINGIRSTKKHKYLIVDKKNKENVDITNYLENSEWREAININIQNDLLIKIIDNYKIELVEINNKEIIKNDSIMLYDISVENDKSYTVNDIICHNSACTTYSTTGFGSRNTQASVVNECASVTKKHIIADGGIKQPADITKSIVMGASMVMVGGMLSSFIDSPGKIVTINNDKFKEFYGSASAKQSNKTSRIEGTVILNKLKNSDMLSYMEYLSECLQSSISYAGGVNIDSLHSVRWI